MLLPLTTLILLSSTAGSGLEIDGKTSLTKRMGSPVHILVTGTPGQPATLLMDVDPGPSIFRGVSVPLGLTPALRVFPLGLIPGGGSIDLDITLPNKPSLANVKMYVLAVITDPALPGGFELSNSVEVTLVDRNMQLAGNPLGSYPSFEYVSAFNEGAPIGMAVETSEFPEIIGRTGDIYVVDSKTRAEWISNPTLTDVGSGPQTQTFTAGPISANQFRLNNGTLSGNAGAGLGVGYDIVIDLNQDGVLNGDDFIDGYSDESGLYVVHDLTLPGPYSVIETQYSGGTWLNQDTYYPSNIGSLGEVPLIVISHGNGHNYRWYDHIGEHMASYGYVVMSHSNNTSPGIFSASTTTLTNTDYFLSNLASIDGGVLDGHIDSHNITWLGHSRGGEGVVQAYDRVHDGLFIPTDFVIEDIKLVSSIAPTGFQSPTTADPHEVTYHVWTGEADNDVNGCASNTITWTFQIHDRAQQKRLSTSLHGVGHGDFHDGGGSSVASGPCLVGRPTTHTIMRGYFLPLVKHVIEGNVPAKDYLWRQWESFRPIGSPSNADNACVFVDLQLRDGNEVDRFVLDDFQTNPLPSQSSSGGAVVGTVSNLAEDKLRDNNGSFTNSLSDPFNGFTYATSADLGRGMVFDYNSDSTLGFELVGDDQNVSRFDYFSFRAAQGTRHPFTTSLLADQIFSVTLSDADGVSSTISIGAYGGGIEEPYQRSSCGIGVGWGNEFETIRIRLSDFQHDGSALNLCQIKGVTFNFGPSSGTSEGRLGIDDLQFVAE
ncbi:MAG: hypothetical protein O3A95_03070 [Planctomycetota bacterium]|nr:hypothetical protein [Planctomycetota bacterium]